MKNYKTYLYSFGVIAALIVLFYFLGEIILPFFVGLIGAFMVNPLVKKIQKIIPNRNLAVTSLLLALTGFILGVVLIFGVEIVNDIKRLNNAFEIFAEDHHEEIDETNQKIKLYIEKIYSSDQIQQGILQAEEQQDSLKSTAMDQMQTALSGITSFLGSGDQDSTENESGGFGFNWLIILFGSMIYFFYIIYSFEYFEKKVKKYFDGDFKKNHFIKNFMADFKRIFLVYFRKRTEVVLICFLIMLSGFLILNLPGAIMIALLAALLCYIPHFQYIILIPVSLSCWVLSIETGTDFLVFYAIVGGILILISILEETIFTPKIMKEYNGLNPAIMIVSFSVWTYLFGPVFGTLIALPLTTVVLIYLDQLLLHTKKVLTEKE